MKNVLFLVFCMLIASMSFAQTKSVDAKSKAAKPAMEAPADGGPAMELERTKVDYGTIEQDSDPYRYFKFKNTGDAPLVIKHAKGSCGCTVPDYPKEPIMPGQESEIKVKYATNRPGPFTKTITLTTNEGEDPKGMKRVITITGKVTPKPKEVSVPESSPSIFAPK